MKCQACEGRGGWQPLTRAYETCVDCNGSGVKRVEQRTQVLVPTTRWRFTDCLPPDEVGTVMLYDDANHLRYRVFRQTPTWSGTLDNYPYMRDCWWSLPGESG